MALPTYKEALKMGKEKLSEALVPVRARRAQKQAELEMCKLDEQIATKQADLQEACCKEDVSFPRIIELQDAIALIERKRKQYQNILDEMFPEDGCPFTAAVSAIGTWITTSGPVRSILSLGSWFALTATGMRLRR